MGAGALESEHPRRAVELAQASLRSARDSGEDEPLGLAYYFLFASLVAADRADEALAMRDEGLAFLEHLGAMRQLAGFLNELGWLQEELGDWPSAAETYARVMDAAGRAGGTEQAILATFNLASLRLRQGRVSDAASGLRQALAVWRPAGYDIGVANALWAQADLAVTEGRFDLVEARALEAAELFEQLEQHEAYHATMTSLALGAAICGEPEGCFRVLHQIAGEGARVSPAAEVARRASRAAGIAHAALGDIDKALVEFRRAVAERSRRRKGREPIGEAAHDAFETALSLHAWAQLRDRLGEPPDFWRDRISAVFEQRDVVRLPSVAGGEPVAVRRAAAVGSS
jgi:tetratricopeptide (TPR) repeat protein